MHRSFNELKKSLKKDSSALPVLKLALLADSASQFFAQALKASGIESGYRFDLFEADYDQIEMQIFDRESELYRSNPDFIILFYSAPKLQQQFYKTPADERNRFAENQLRKIQQLSEAISAASSASIICLNLPLTDDSVFGNYANKTAGSWLYQLRMINSGLMQLAANNNSFFIADVDLLQSRVGAKQSIDERMYINADLVFALDFLPAVSQSVTEIILAASGKFKKCLILDLDNTLWGGIVGDDGIENIQLGDLGTGKAFSAVQRWAKALKERGIILAVCSKNTEAVAKEPFEKHPDMILRLDDIAVFVANWETKVDNIRHIQSVLNIGFDSMVFLDDNPFERNMVREHIEGICVPELPEDPAEYLSFLQSANLFETASYSSADRERTKQYQEESGRVQFQKTFHSESEFLQSLEMQATVKPVDAFSIPRVAQLSQRSNQFNLRTVRYSENDLIRISDSANHFTLTFSLRDRFGDYGLIAVIVLEKKNDQELFIETWLMSCRVLKRGMENFTLNAIAALARKNGFEKITGEYIPTSKNGMVANHYAGLGFSETNGKWTLHLDSFAEKTAYISAEI